MRSNTNECGLKSRLFPFSFMNNFICGCKPATFKYASNNRKIILTDKQLSADKLKRAVTLSFDSNVGADRGVPILGGRVLYGVKINGVRFV